MPGVHLDQMLRFCGALTIVTGQSTVTINKILAAVEGDMNTHPSSIPGGLNNLTGLQALSQLTGLDAGMLGNLAGMSGLSGLSGLTGMSGLSSMMGGLGVNISGLSSAISSIGSLSGSGIGIGNIGNIGSIASSIGSISGISVGGGGVLSQLGNISSAIGAGGLGNLGSLSGLGGIAGIGSMGNYLGAAQSILGAGGSMSGIANALSSAAGMSGGPGALVSASPGTITIEGKKLITALMDQSLPDVIGLIQHVTNFPTPQEGSPTVSAYGGVGTIMGGLGNILGGNLLNGELVSMAGNVIGQMQNFTNIGSGQGLAILQGLNGGTLGSIPSIGSTILGQTSGNSFTFSSVQT